MGVASGTQTSDDGFREQGNWCSFDTLASEIRRRNCIAFAGLRKVIGERQSGLHRKKVLYQLHTLGSIASHTTSTTRRTVKAPTPPRLPSRWTLLHPPRPSRPLYTTYNAQTANVADAASRTNAHAGATVTPVRTSPREPRAPTAPQRTPPCGQLTPTQRQQICPQNHRAPQAKWPCTEERRSEQEGGYGDEPNEMRLSGKLASGEGDCKSWTPPT